MAKHNDILWEPEHNTNFLPLRWVANLFGNIASGHLLKAACLEESEDSFKNTVLYAYHSKMWSFFWPLYDNYGTWYKQSETLKDYLDTIDMSGDDWNDYDKDGVPYWEKTGTIDPDYDYEKHHWDYVDEETGDALKVINYGRP